MPHHSRLRRRLGATTLVLAATSLAAAPAAAQFARPYNFTCSMTAKTCVHPLTFCEIVRVELEKTTPGVCKQILGDLKAQEAGRVIGTERVVNFANPERTHDKSIYRVPLDLKTVRVGGLTTGYAGLDQNYLVRLLAEGFKPFIERYNKQQGWRANGFGVTTCEEYAYEKYYDLSRFEEATMWATLHGDYQAIYNAAYVSGTAKIGADALGGNMLQDFQGDVIGELDFPGGALKNEYAQTPIGDVDAGPYVMITRSPDGEGGSIGFPATGHLLVTVPNLPRATSVTGIVFKDPTLRQALDAARTEYSRTDKGWLWHSQMAAANAGVSATDRQEIDEAKDVFVGLLKQRTQLVQALGRLRPARAPIEATIDPGLRNPIDEVINPGLELIRRTPTLDSGWLVRGGLTFAVEGGTAAPMTRMLRVPRDGEGRSETAGARMISMRELTARPIVLDNTQPDVWRLPPLLNAPPGALDDGECNAVCLAYKLAWLDEQIERALADARDRGCLEPLNTICDWSPRTFARALADGEFVHTVEGKLERASSFTALRERDLAACREFTGDETIEPHTYPPLTDTSGPEPVPYFSGCGLDNTEFKVDCSASPEKLEECQRCYAAQFEAVATMAGQLVDPTTHQVSIKEAAGDAVNQGSGLFGLHFDYNTTYEMKGLLPGETNQQAVILTSNLGAQVFGTYFALLAVDISGGDASAPAGTMTILGTDMGISALPFHLVQHPAIDQTIAGAEHDFMAGPIPIHVEAGVAGRVGVDYQLVGGALAGGGTGLEAVVSPYAGVNAYLQAGVGFKYASIGVRGRLVLAEVGLPVSTAGVVREQSGGRELDIRLAADLVYRFLSGQVSAYIEISPPWPLPDWDHEEELTSWDGYERKQALFARNVKRVPLGVLGEVAAMVCAQDATCCAQAGTCVP